MNVRSVYRSVSGTLSVAAGCLMCFVGIYDCRAQQTSNPAPAKQFKPGSTLPIYLHESALAEAISPTIDLTEGASFWMPGPERFYGYALRDLSDYLQRISGAKYPLTAASAGVDDGSGIYAGTFDQFQGFRPQQLEAQKAMASDDPEAFVVEVQDDRLYILGRSNLGLIAGVYTLLDKLGVKWFAPGQQWENVPTLSSLNLDVHLNMASAGPSYNVRLFFPSFGVNTSVLNKGEREAAYTLWNLRNRMGGSGYVANYHNQSVVAQELFTKRPELFAVINGKRDPREIARANPEVVNLSIQNAIKYLNENDGKGSYFNSFSVEPGDGVPPDEESLQNIGNHTPTDLLFWFANQMAQGIKDAGLKDKWIGVLSYSDHAGVPSFDLHPQVGVQLATSLDTSSGMTVEERLDGFRECKAQRLGLYDYPSMVLWSRDQPGRQINSNPLEYVANLRRWHEHGANGYLAETSDSWINSGAGHYLASRVMWDIEIDPQKELVAYYQGAFGSAADEIRALYEDWGKGWRSPVPLTRARLAKWHHLISEAGEKLKDKPNYLARINEIKRYYLYVNHLRELGIDLKDPRMPSREARFARMLRYIGANRGTGAFHANALLPTLLIYLPLENLRFDPADLGAEFVTLSQQGLLNEDVWKGFGFIGQKQIDQMFADVKLPLNGQSTNPAVLDPAIRTLPNNASSPVQIRFPRLHGTPNAAHARQYILRVIAPTPRLTFDVLSDNAAGNGEENRTCIIMDENGDALKTLKFRINTPTSFDLTEVEPGIYTAIFPEFGSEQLTVSGGNVLGAVRAPQDNWGFNPLRSADLRAGESYKSYFAVPAGQSLLKVALAHGAVSMGFQDGKVIAEQIQGSAELQKQGLEVKFVASENSRIAYVQWQEGYPGSQGLVIEGITLFSPDASYVLYESLN